MKLSSRKIDRGKTFELSMTSMIDVVFLLLIFFMTTSAFIRTERELPSAIQKEKESATQPRSDLEPVIIEVVRSGDRFVYKLGTRQIDSREELTELLRLFQNKSDGAFVRAGDEAPFGMAAGAIQACKSASFPTVSYVPLYRVN